MITVCRALSHLFLQLPAVIPWWLWLNQLRKLLVWRGFIPLLRAKFSPGHFQWVGIKTIADSGGYSWFPHFQGDRDELLLMQTLSKIVVNPVHKTLS